MSSHLIYRNPTREDESSLGLVYQLPGENIGKPLPDLLFRVPQQSRFRYSFLYISKASLGVGVLVLPYTFRLLGIIGAVICLLITAISVMSCMDTMIHSMHIVAHRMNKQIVPYNYAYKLSLYNGTEKARFFSYWGEHAVDFLLVASQIGTCSVHLAFTCEITHQILNEFFPVDFLWHVLFQSIIYFLLIVFIRLFRTLFYISVIGNCLAILGLMSIIIDVVLGSSPKDIRLFGDDLFYNLPVCYGIHLFALVSVGIANTLSTRDTSLRNHGGAINLNFICMFVLYTIVGSVGYLFHGEDAQPVLFENLRASIWTTCTISTYTLSVLISIPLQAYPVTSAVMEYFYRTYGVLDSHEKLAFNRKTILNITIQACLVIFSAQLMMVVKNIHHLVSLTGSLFMTPVCIVLPCVMKWVIVYPHLQKKSMTKLCYNTLLIALGLYVILLGGLYNIMFIYQSV